MQKITPCLWFDKEAEEAANLYISLFNSSPGKKGESKILTATRYDEAGAKVSGMPAGSVLTVEFELEGQKFLGLNGGPVFKFTEAVSFMVSCETQEEVDHFWYKLSAVPESEQCGWLKDKFGLSWQIVPTILPKLLGDKDPKKAQNAMKAMLQMKKLDIEGLKKAAEGK